jgi:hypothetical protein
MFMNEFEIDQAQRRFANHPVLSRAARLLNAVREDANANSDGWAYWRKPSAACKKLMELLQRGEANETEYRMAVAAVRSFYTRMKTTTKGRYPQFPENAA